MEMQDRHAGADFFEVILCFENNTWLFSTYAQSFQIEDALDKAEDEFLIHTALHDISTPRATSAYVLTDFGKHFFSKRNGKWQTSNADAADRIVAFPVSDKGAAGARATAH